MNPCLDSPLCCTLSRSLLDTWRDDGRTDGNRLSFSSLTSAAGAGVGGQRQFSLSLIMDHQLTAARISLFIFPWSFSFSVATVTSLLRDNSLRKQKKTSLLFSVGLGFQPCVPASRLYFNHNGFFPPPVCFFRQERPVQRQDNNTLDAPRHRLAHTRPAEQEDIWLKMAAAFLGVHLRFFSFSMMQGRRRIWQATQHEVHSMAIANTFTEVSLRS